MSQYTDSDYLKREQYADSSKLNARIRLHKLYDTNPNNLQHWAFDRLRADAPPSCRLLELGCGSGEFWVKNKDRIPDDWVVTLSDFSPGMLDDAKKHLEGFNLNFQVINAQEIPFEDNTFDVVLAYFMLYHVPERRKAIADIRRVLKPDGVLHAITLGEAHMRELHELVYCVSSEMYPGYNVVNRPFSLENGAEQLIVSFESVKLVPYDCALEVTEVQPLIDYVLSMGLFFGQLNESQIQQIRDKAQSRIAENGLFHITKDTGLFIAKGYAGE